MANELIGKMRDAVTTYAFNFAREEDKAIPEPEKGDVETVTDPVERWVLFIRESMLSFNLMNDDKAIADTLGLILDTDDKIDRDRRVQFLLNGTTDLLSSFTQEEIAAATKHLAWSLGWSNRSSFLDETLIESCGSEEHFQELFTDAPWTLFIYLLTSDTRVPQ